MPSYDYLCPQCGKLFEVRATFAEKNAGLNPECPVCHTKDTHQVITTGLLLRTDTSRPATGCCGSTSGSGSGCCRG